MTSSLWARSAVALSALAIASVAHAQTSPVEPKPEPQENRNAGAARASDALTDDIVVTATKKTTGESLQRVPISATALGEAQLEALQLKSIETLAFKAPNVQLDSLGTQKGIANFTIRGVGVNSSVPSVEPAVGTFIDGVYLGTNMGVVIDTFDIESVEILRGPQGVLFGRNVTGGAVTMRTRRPNGDFSVRGKASWEQGFRGSPMQTIAASVEGSLVEDKLFAKLTGYYSHDGGYFYNTTLKRDAGRSESWFVRPTLVFKPTDTIDTTLIVETGKDTGDGTTARNRAGVVNAKTFEVAQNFPGRLNFSHTSVTSETNIDTDFGDGKITSIAGYRKISQDTGYDVDGSSQSVYNILYYTRQHQFSEELRYAGRFLNAIDLVTGVYYFHQNLNVVVRDDLIDLNRYRDYGGRQISNTYGIFLNTDTSLTDKLKLGLGLRYSVDKKRANIVNGVLTPAPQYCNFEANSCSFYPFQNRKKFGSMTPRVALSYQFTPESQVYASYSRGYRAGGYNIRNSSAASPGPFGDEKADAFEIGAKTDLFDRKLRFNIAAFHTKIRDVQRTFTLVLPTGTTSTLDNAGDIRLQGFEGDATFKVAKGLVLQGTVGYTDGKYTKLTTDLNGDGVVNAADYALKIPRLAKWTYGASIVYDFDISAGVVTLQADFNHRDGSPFSDSNFPGETLPSVDNVFAIAAFQPHALPGTKFSIYGRNLLDQRMIGLNTQILAIPTSGYIEVPQKGRVLGAEFSWRF